MKCVFSLDDFCYEERDVLSYLKILNEYFNNFKVSMFTIPCYMGNKLSEKKEWLEALPENIEHILHGYFHTHRECQHLDHMQAKHFIELGIEEFRKCGFPIIPGYKCPNWTLGEGIVSALIQKNFWVAPYTPRHDPGEIKTYHWNWDIGEEIPTNVEMLHAHGHTHSLSGPGKGIQDSMDNVLKLPRDTEFFFISEIEGYG